MLPFASFLLGFFLNPKSETGNPPEGWESEGQIPNPQQSPSVCYQLYFVKSKSSPDSRGLLGIDFSGCSLFSSQVLCHLKRFHGLASHVSVALMSSFVVVMIKPGIEVVLELFKALVELLSESNAEELI